jgi:hypothetical protein
MVIFREFYHIFKILTLVPGSGHVLQHRVHEMSQACRILHRARSALHALEADRLLLGIKLF